MVCKVQCSNNGKAQQSVTGFVSVGLHEGTGHTIPEDSKQKAGTLKETNIVS